MSLGILGAVVVHIFKIYRDAQIYKAFIRDVARNHLPHIEGSLKMIADQLGITIEDAPRIKFVDLNGRDK